MQKKRSARRECGDLVQENAQHAGDAATLCTKLRRQRTKSKGKSVTSRDRGSRFLKMRNSRNAILKRQTADGESRTQGGNRRLRKMNGVGWLQKSAVCGKIDSYGASRGHFRCKSGRECHAGERFHVLVAQRMSTVSHAMRFFTSHADGFACYACAFCIVTDDFVRHAFTSPADDFARHALFYIARRRFRVLRVCFLHRTAVISHTAHAFASSPVISHSVCVLFTSPGGDFVRHAFTSLADDFTRHASFTSPGGDFAHCARFYIARRRFRSSCVLLHERKGKI